MKNSLLVVLLALILLLGFEQFSQTQTKPETPLSGQDKKPQIIARQNNQTKTFAYDAGEARFMASSEETNGAWATVELAEKPGYKTSIHRHNGMDEAYYVLEGVLTAKVADKTYELPAGSYLVIPRGTPHAQGNFGKVPVKVLLTVTPGGFEGFFKDRIELLKVMSPNNSEFGKKMDEIVGRYDLEVLSRWEIKK
ncbi:MAG: cupin domain-containing protein [Pyrinomonadaceae bacterium]